MADIDVVSVASDDQYIFRVVRPKRTHSTAFPNMYSMAGALAVEEEFPQLRTSFELMPGAFPESPIPTSVGNVLPDAPSYWNPSAASSAPATSVSTTVKKLIPTFPSLLDFLKLPFRLAQRYSKPQVICAEPVLRQDGSRKKILLGAEARIPRAFPKSPPPEPIHSSHPASMLSAPIEPLVTPEIQPATRHNNRVALLSQFKVRVSESKFPKLSSEQTLKQPPNHNIRNRLSLLSQAKIRLDSSKPPKLPLIKQPSHGRRLSYAAITNVRSNQPKTTRTIQTTPLATVREQPSPAIEEQPSATVNKQPQPDASLHATLCAPPHTAPDAPPGATPYCEDLSFLPDAPPRKSVTWTRHCDIRLYDTEEQMPQKHQQYVQEIKSSPLTNVASPYAPLEQLNDLSLEDSSLLELQPSPEGVKAIRDQFEQGRSTKEEEHRKWEPKLAQQTLKTINEVPNEEESTQPLPPQQSILQPPVIKPLVAPLSARWAKELDDAAGNASHGRRQIEIGPHGLNTHDFGTLLQKDFGGSDLAWLNDNIVNGYLKILVDHLKSKAGWVKRSGKPPAVHVFASQWWVNVNNHMKLVENWSRRANLEKGKLLDAELILFPLCDHAHWTLLAIKPKLREIEYLDSLANKDSNPVRYVEKAKEWLRMELGSKFVEKDWTVVKGRSLRQLNGRDCGIFTCLNALALLRGEGPDRVIPVNGMLEARRQVAATLINGKSIGEFE
ncbi:cysteine proteinase [Zopfia rhizophila CBS 207.26]|uniref:Cysteine proteinase n=1 Tax=Zopfia rhizophila CBS 207.26 TaxID=1314779 RepID=A0A6A6EAP4_9PEZI|nr:cysteine proteinase [Zopfia rhizophila CBS 207.26]